MTRELSIAELAALAADTEDQTETQVSGDYEREVIPAGPNFARFVEYIEIGKHPQKAFQGKEKPDTLYVRLTFEMLHKKSIVEYEQNGVKKTRGQLLSLRVKKSLSDKASFKKLFSAMTYGRDSIKHMAQMLGEPFLVSIHHNVVKDTAGKETTYVNLNNKDGVYSIGAPQIVDPISEAVTDLRTHIPEPFAPIRIFLWDNPTKGTWDSLFIDGTREVKAADGTVTQESKNWLQESIISASNFNGSPLHSLLHGVAELPLVETSVEPVAAAEQVQPKIAELPPATPTASPSKQAEKAAEPVAAAKATPASENSAADALAALGLV